MEAYRTFIVIAVLLGLIVVLSGCGGKPSVSENGRPKAPSQEKGTKGHGEASHSHESAHGGVVNTVGSFHVELVVDQKKSALTAYISGEDGKTPKYIDADSITAQIKHEGVEEFTSLELRAAPLDGRTGARFEAAAGDLVNASSLEIFLRLTVDGKQYRTAYQVSPGHAAVTHKSYICPMRCEKDRVYPVSRNCPVCEMALVEFKEGQVEHADHTPKHGGVFFMAADNWHHLEGVMASSTEFRLYIYDNFTKPISVKDYDGTAEVVRRDAKGDDLGKTARLKLKSHSSDNYLVATIPDEYFFPLLFTVRVTLVKGEKPALFNFPFDSISKAQTK